jgi:hypothetical protein
MRKSEDDSELVEACERIGREIEHLGAPYGGLDYVCAAIKEGFESIKYSFPGDPSSEIDELTAESKKDLSGLPQLSITLPRLSVQQEDDDSQRMPREDV